MNSIYIRFVHHIKHRGLLSLFRTSLRKLVERIHPPRAKSFELAKEMIAGKEGFEIGGPSRVFSKLGLFPLYDISNRIDNCNFGDNTIWEGALEEGQDYKYGKGRVLGTQYIRDAVDLKGLPSEKYDFVCSAYMIQHSANPIRALFEWIRILKDGGVMILLVPHKDKTFDRRRPLTLFDHLVEDYDRGTAEDDQSHISEVLEFHDLSLDPLAGSYEEFKRRTLNNSENRAVHQHAFDVDLVIRMLSYVGLRICNVEVFRPDNIIVICEKIAEPESVDNTAFYSNKKTYTF